MLSSCLCLFFAKRSFDAKNYAKFNRLDVKNDYLMIFKTLSTENRTLYLLYCLQ